MIKSSINYLPINEEDIDSGLYVRGVGFQSIQKESTYPLNGHDQEYDFDPAAGRTLGIFSLVYLTNGSGHFTSSSVQNSPISAGNMVLLHPHKWHTYQPDKEIGWDEYWVTFSGDLFESHLHLIATPEKPFIHVGKNEKIESLFNEMIYFAERQEVGYQRPLTGILLHIIGIIHSIERNRAFNQEDVKHIENARSLMRKNVNSAISPEQIAEKVNMNYSSFRKLFKQYTGLSPLQFMLQLRLEKAKEQLLFTNYSIKEIAAKLNYDSQDYFTYFFRSKVGLSPLEYRKKHKQTHKCRQENHRSS